MSSKTYLTLPVAPSEYDSVQESTFRKTVQDNLQDIANEFLDSGNHSRKDASLSLRRFQFVPTATQKPSVGEFFNLNVGGSVVVSSILDEDNMASDSDTALATQQSIKAYIDSSPSGPTSLNGLTDVTITSPSSDQVLKYNGSLWVNSAVPSVSLSSLSDVTITSVATNDYLRWSGSAWVNDASSPSGVTQISSGAGISLSPSTITSTGTVSMDLLGLELLTNPGANKVPFYRNAGSTFDWLLFDSNDFQYSTSTTLSLASGAVGFTTAGTGLVASGASNDTVSVKYSSGSNLIDGAATGSIDGADYILFQDDSDASIVKKDTVAQLPFVGSVAGTAPIVSSGGTSPTISLNYTVALKNSGSNLVVDIETNTYDFNPSAGDTMDASDIVMLFDRGSDVNRPTPSAPGVGGTYVARLDQLDLNLMNNNNANFTANAFDTAGTGLVENPAGTVNIEYTTPANFITSATGGLLTGLNAADRVAIADQTDNVVHYTSLSDLEGYWTINAGSQITGILPLANGGTGAALVDPNADRILFWDDSAGAMAFLQIAGGLEIPVAAPTTIQVDTGAGLQLTGGEVATDLAGLGTSAGPMVSTDRFIINDNGVDQQIAPINIPLSIFSNDANFTSNAFNSAGDGLVSPSTNTVAVDYAGPDNYILDTRSLGALDASGTGDRIPFSDNTDNTVYYTTPQGIVNVTAITESQITDGSILARVASNETITGAYTFTDQDGIFVNAGAGGLYLQNSAFHAASLITAGLKYVPGGGTDNSPYDRLNWEYTDTAGASNNAGSAVIMKGNGSEAGLSFEWYTAPTSTGAGANPASLTKRLDITTAAFEYGTSAQFRVTSAGLITAGEWDATTIAVAHGGTGISGGIAADQFLVGNGTGNPYVASGANLVWSGTQLTINDATIAHTGTGGFTGDGSGLSSVNADTFDVTNLTTEARTYYPMFTDGTSTGVSGFVNSTDLRWKNTASANQLLLADGAAATPIIGFISDEDTGVYLSGTAQLSFAAGGTEKLRVASSGPISYDDLTVELSGTSNSNIYLKNATGTRGYIQAQNSGLVTLATEVAGGQINLRDNANSLNLIQADYNGTDTVRINSNGNNSFAINATGTATSAIMRWRFGGTDEARIQWLDSSKELRVRLEDSTDRYSIFIGGASGPNDRRFDIKASADHTGVVAIENAQFYVDEDNTTLSISSGVVTCNWDRGNQLHLDLDNTVTEIDIVDNDMYAGGSYILMISEGTSAPASVTWTTTDTLYWANGIEPELNSGDLNDITVVQFFKTETGDNRIIGSWFMAQ